MEHPTTVRPPLAGWMGGKSLLAKTIISRIPEHTCYVEPFAGAAWVLFRKPTSPVEVINDLNREVVTLYRVIQLHLEEFCRYFKWILISRDEFERLKRVQPDTLTDIQRAARFWYIQRGCFGGRIVSPSFGTSTDRPPKLNLLRIEEELSSVHLRLAQVTVECLPYHEAVARYDREHTFFYLDPPYYGVEGYYGKGLFERGEFARMAELLGGIKGRFILSINDLHEVRSIFAGFHIEEVKTRYTCSKSHNNAASELLISNC